MKFSDNKYPNLNVKKGDILQSTGEVNNEVYYVVKGILRSFTIDEVGKQHTYMFGAEDWIVGDTNDYDEPCDLYIDVLEDSTIKVIDKREAIQESRRNNALFKRINVLQKRIVMMLSYTSKQKYEYFLKLYPSIPNRVPQKMIASFLGITPETLSHVKRKVLFGK